MVGRNVVIFPTHVQISLSDTCSMGFDFGYVMIVIFAIPLFFGIVGVGIYPGGCRPLTNSETPFQNLRMRWSVGGIDEFYFICPGLI